MALAGDIGDLFWDLSVPVIYVAGAELPCTVYVANPTDDDHEYCLLARLQSDSTVVSEEAVKVNGAAYFTVEAGDRRALHGMFSFYDSDVTFTLLLCEKESGEVIDSVSTSLVAPTAAAAALWPPGWPTPTVVTTDWSSMLGMMLPLMMMVMMVGMLTSAFREEEKELPAGGRSY